MIFCLNHEDKCSFNGNTAEFYASQKVNFEKRNNDIKEVIDFIHERSAEVFGEGRLNIQKLILGGHSFGGLNALTYGAKDSRVASILTLDPAF